jgi:hypothetical protein
MVFPEMIARLTKPDEVGNICAVISMKSPHFCLSGKALVALSDFISQSFFFPINVLFLVQCLAFI